MYQYDLQERQHISNIRNPSYKDIKLAYKISRDIVQSCPKCLRVQINFVTDTLDPLTPLQLRGEN